MRTTLIVAVLALALLPSVQAQGGPTDPIVHDVRFMLGDQNVTSVDLIDDHGDVLVFEVDAQDTDFGGEILLVELHIKTPGGTIVMRPKLDRMEGDIEVWRGSHTIDDTRLTVGTHPVELRVFDRNGGKTTCPIENGQGTCADGPTVDDVVVTWDSKNSYQLGLGLLDVEKQGSKYPKQFLGAADKLRLDASIAADAVKAPWAMQHVRFTNEVGQTTTAAKSIRSPYVLGPIDLAQGDQELTITATDRAGRTTSFSVAAFVDTVAPEVQPLLPARTFQNVSFEIRLDVHDVNDYSAFVTLGEATQQQNGSTTAPLVPFAFTQQELGTHNLLVRVLDSMGNQFLRQYNITTEAATTDSTIRVQVTPSHPLPEENVTVRFIAQQQSGVAPLPFDVALEVDRLGTVFMDQVEVPLHAPFEFVFERPYLPGQYGFNATIHAIAGVNETDDGDQVDVGFFEVFMGKVVYQDAAYYMRLGSQHEPSHAVSPGGSLYDVTPTIMGNRTVFAFEAKGVDLYWDPLQRITDLTPAEDGEGKDSPGLPLVAALAMLATAAYVARRRM